MARGTQDPNVIAREMAERTERAFQRAVGSVEALMKQLAPVGVYMNRRGRGGRSGGDLRADLRCEYLGGTRAQCVSSLPYARAQHDNAYHHPGLYTRGLAGPKYASRYAEAAAEYVFGIGPLYNPGGLPVTAPPRFADLLDDED